MLLEESSQVVEVPEQIQEQSNISEFVFLNHEDDAIASKSVEEEMPSINVVNGDEISEVNGEGEMDPERQPQNGAAQAYENLVSKLSLSDSDYMKDITEDAQIDENFGLNIDNNILDQFSTFSRDTGLFQ